VKAQRNVGRFGRRLDQGCHVVGEQASVGVRQVECLRAARSSHPGGGRDVFQRYLAGPDQVHRDPQAGGARRLDMLGQPLENFQPGRHAHHAHAAVAERPVVTQVHVVRVRHRHEGDVGAALAQFLDVVTRAAGR
jgi:plasmid stabilization system protein ParE